MIEPKKPRPPRIHVKCIGLLQFMTQPRAVLVAQITVGKHEDRYVLIDEGIRAAFSELVRLTKSASIESTMQLRTEALMLPPLIRTHAFDVHGHMMDDRMPQEFQGKWPSAEPMWVRCDAVLDVLPMLDRWLEENPRTDEQIRAPNWLVLHGAQLLATAAGVPVPQA